MARPPASGALAFALVYFTFFLDNVLLTVLVPIIPDWVRGEALALWAERDAPLAKLLNSTLRHIADSDGVSVGTSQAAVGAVLSAKAAAQLLGAPAAAALTARAGPAPALRTATALLAAAALAFAWCGALGGGAAAACCAGGARALQGGGAALAGVAGLALAARAVSPARRHAALAALLGAVALGVLVGYPFGGIAYKLWSQAAPFQIIAAALLCNLALQYAFLDKEEYGELSSCSEKDLPGVWTEARDGGSPAGVVARVWAEAGGGAARAGAGGVLLTTSVMAALEPCLPLWVVTKFHPQRWVSGAMFVPDSAGYLAACSLGGAARRLGGARVAVGGVLAVALGALALPHATSVWWCGAAQGAVGAGLGACDAALVPALLARPPRARVPHRAALLQAASSAAYVIGPVVGGVVSWWASFETAMRTFGVANLLYAVHMHRALRADPLPAQWGASESEEDSEGEELGDLSRAARPRAGDAL